MSNTLFNRDTCHLDCKLGSINFDRCIYIDSINYDFEVTNVLFAVGLAILASYEQKRMICPYLRIDDDIASRFFNKNL